MTGVFDGAEGKGALLTNETAVKLASGEPLFTLSATLFYRGDGGFGGSAEGAPKPHAIPDRAPDAIANCPSEVIKPWFMRCAATATPCTETRA